MIIRIYIVNILLGKTQLGQNLYERKNSMIYPYQYSPSHVDIIILFSMLQLINLLINFLILMLYLNFFNDNIYEIYARLSYDRICWTSIPPFSKSLWVYKNLGQICIASFITFNKSSFNLCSTNYIIFIELGRISLIEDRPHDSWIC